MLGNELDQAAKKKRARKKKPPTAEQLQRIHEWRLAHPLARPVTLTPREGTITCRRWLASPVVGRRLFVCASGHIAIERDVRAVESATYQVWHLTSEHRDATQHAWDSDTVSTLLSFIAPDDLDAPGIIFTV